MSRREQHEQHERIVLALSRLGVRRFVLGIHPSAFPAGTGDVGYGSPWSDSGRAFFRFARSLGFDAVQLGPSGQITDDNVSPYDSTIFARNILSIDLAALVDSQWYGLLDAADLETPEAGERTRADHRAARVRMHRALSRASERFRRLYFSEPAHPLSEAFTSFRTESAPWLDRDALFETLAEKLGHDDPERFPPDARRLFDSDAQAARFRRAAWASLEPDVFRHEFAQFVAHRQHAQLRNYLADLGLCLFADLQVGYSHRDAFIYKDAFVEGWLLGAPPSRTNPEGQPWGYPVLHPDQLDDAQSPARLLLARRFEKALQEHDGVRIDHPHGLVCPWVYRAKTGDAHASLRAGTRLFESPDSDDPQLARWAIARESDLCRDLSRSDEDWVRQLDDAQVARYGRLIALVLKAATACGRDRRDVACEVLSTCPYPLKRVLARFGLGRFLVTEKADLGNPNDPYRSDRARPEDWIMLGTHDTLPVFTVASRWVATGDAHNRAAYLAERLVPDAAERAAVVRQWSSSVPDLVTAHLADLFVSDAETVYVFFGDLFGETAQFNQPGVVHAENWTMRAPADFERCYRERCESGRALHIARALALALRALSLDSDGLADALVS